MFTLFDRAFCLWVLFLFATKTPIGLLFCSFYNNPQKKNLKMNIPPQKKKKLQQKTFLWMSWCEVFFLEIFGAKNIKKAFLWMSFEDPKLPPPIASPLRPGLPPTEMREGRVPLQLESLMAKRNRGAFDICFFFFSRFFFFLGVFSVFSRFFWFSQFFSFFFFFSKVFFFFWGGSLGCGFLWC